MLAELVVDLSDLGTSIGHASGRSISILPKLPSLSRMWKRLGIDVTAIHLVAPDFSPRNGDTANFEALHTSAWWKSEQVFLDHSAPKVSLQHYPPRVGGGASDALVVTTALARSDALADAQVDRMVIVMSNHPGVAPAVTHARGVPVMIAGTTIADPALAHIRLDREWLGTLNARHSSMELGNVELRAGRPWCDNEAISTPYGGLEGRLSTDWSVSGFAKSIALFDPGAFSLGATNATAAGTAPSPEALATTIERLGLGELVHIETIDARDPHIDTSSVATLYRYAADYPELAIIVASARETLIAATSDLLAHSMPNPRRFLRLCVLHREITFDESVYANDLSACRMVLEKSQSELLFDQSVVPQVPQEQRAALTLVGNPETIREDAIKWRRESQRRLLLLGVDGMTAGPADALGESYLPVSLGGCSDFEARHPRLRPGSIVEGVRSEDGERWVIVSDPVERRRWSRSQPSGDDPNSRASRSMTQAA